MNKVGDALTFVAMFQILKNQRDIMKALAKNAGTDAFELENTRNLINLFEEALNKKES